MRLVLDTNVVLSAIIWRGTPHRLLSTIGQRFESHQLFSSETLLSEFDEVLKKPHLAKLLAIGGQSRAQMIANYVGIVKLVAPKRIPPASRDANDDQVIACAIAAKADAIVSGDNNLLTLESYQGIPILTARQALERIEAGSRS